MSVKTLILIRHAQAQPGNDDKARPLTWAGRRQAHMLGVELVNNVGSVGEVLYSSAQRTKQTFDEIAQSLPVGRAQAMDALYLADVPLVLSFAREFHAETAMIIGHEPTISRVGAAVVRREEQMKLVWGVGTGTALIVRYEGEWQDLGSAPCELTILRISPEDAETSHS